MRLSKAADHLRARTYWLRVSELPLEDRNILYFTVDTALQGLMMGGIFTFISVFLVRLGASKLMVSLLTSLPAIVLMLCAIPAGQYVQRQRNLVRLTNRTRILHRGSILVVALLPSILVGPSLVGAIVAVWAAKSSVSAVLEASWTGVVADIIPPARRASVNGARWALLSVVTAAAVFLFGIVLERVAFPLNYQIVFLVSFLGGVAGMTFFARLRIPESASASPASGPRVPLWSQLRTYLRTLNVPPFLRYQGATFVLRFALNMCVALYSIYWIRTLDASDRWISWQATAGKLALIAGYLFWGRTVSRRGRHRPLLICTLGVGLYPVLLALIPNQVWLVPIAVIQGFFSTGINLSLFGTLLNVVPAKGRASFFALNTMLSSLTIFVAPLVGSWLANWVDVLVVFFIAGAIHVLAVLLLWRFRVGA